MKVIRECRERGHDVKVYTLRWEAPLIDYLDVEMVPVMGLSRHTQYEHFAQRVMELISKESFDLVIGFNKMPGLDVYYAGDSCFIEKALQQRDTWYRLLPRFKSFYRAEGAVFDEHADTQILTLSNVEVPRYRHHYRTGAERFHALPPGIEKDRIAPPDRLRIRAQLRSEFELDDDHLVLVFVGSGFIKKGLDRALLAVASLPGEVRDRVHMFVIGRDRSDAFERMAMRLGIAAQVTFFNQGRDDVPRFLFAADGLLHPAYDETAGMVIIEAMLAGLPALVTKNCGYASYLSEHSAGIVLDTPFSQDDLNLQLQRLLTSEERAQWVANGLASSQHEALFQLVPRAVDYFEQFARQRRPLLVFTLFRYFPHGGLQRDFMRIALACRDRGYRILVYCLDWQGEQPEGFQVIQPEVSAVANHYRYQQFVDYVLSDLEMRLPACVIGFNKMPGLDVYYAADPCFEQKARQQRGAWYRRSARYRTFAAFEQAVFDPAKQTQVMLITKDQQRDFQHYYETPSSRFHLLPPGVNRDRLRGPTWLQQRHSIREEFQLDDDNLLVLQIGSSGFITKGLDRTLQAVASLAEPLGQQVRLLVVGADSPGQFQRLARTLNIEQQVIWASSRDDIPAILQAADLMVHPAYAESGGMALVESVIAGLPVVASGTCGFAPYIKQADAGVVLDEPFCQQQLNTQLEQMLQDAPARQQWSRNGILFGQQHAEIFDMPQHALAVIEGYIEQHRPGLSLSTTFDSA